MSDPRYPSSGGYPDGSGAPGPYGQNPYPNSGYGGYPPGPPQGGYPPGVGPSGGPPSGGRGNTPLIVAIVVLVAVALGSVGYLVLGGDDGDDGDGGEGVAADGGQEPEVRTDLTAADLEPALLTVEDVPPELIEQPWEDDPEDDLRSEDIDASQECKDAIDRFSMVDDDRVRVGSEFQSENGAGLTNTLSLTVPDDVTVAEFRAGMDACQTFSFDDGVDSGTVTLTTESVDGIGENAFGMTMVIESTAQGTSVTAELYGIFSERGGVHSTVTGTGSFDVEGYVPGQPLEGAPADRDMIRAAAEAVDARVETVVSG